MRGSRARRLVWGAGAALLFWALPAPLAAEGFSEKPTYIDPALKGWVAPLRTLLFQVGCGEFYSVYGIYIGEHRELNVLSRSKLTLRRFEMPKLQRFADKLTDALAPVAADLARREMIEGVVLDFYAAHLRGNLLELEVYESCLPARSVKLDEPVPLCLVERRQSEIPTP
ncbi:MAG: hypothetical protein HZB55_01460 [Deltaproteobacteria bacterium]|nr:hypothetical protein [Deltaproteobacteria bacterium]